MNQEIRGSLDTGSFRDRNGRVYLVGERVIRGLSQSALDNFDLLAATTFYREAVSAGTLVETWRLPKDDVPLTESVRAQWAGFVEHRRLPVITYPYEWTFGMLKDAAALQLELLEAAIRAGITTKDATPYNFQFDAGRPVFIDIPSFEKLERGSPWTGYRQFCEMFLFPLMIQAYKGIDFQPLLRAGIDGIPLQTAAGLFGLRDRLRSGVLSHIWLQSKLDKRYSASDMHVRKDLASAGFNEEMILANIRRLGKLVQRLDWNGSGSEWGEYESFHNYTSADQALKESFIEECTAASGAQRVWDIGCNTGRYARIAARHAEQVIAMDKDHFAVERLYRESRSQGAEHVIPILQDIANPSPNWGWRNRERLDLVSRVRPQLVLCLALIHHVVISANVPVKEFIDWLANTTDQLIIEYVSREDEKVQILLRNKSEAYADYSRASLEAALSDHFTIDRTVTLGSGNRFLYWCRRV